MGNLCGKENSVGVIEYQQTTPIKDHNNRNLKTRDQQVNDWKSLIKKLTGNKLLEVYALSKMRNSFTSLSELYTFLSKSPAKNSTEKAWVIYIWITHNIEYNIKGLQVGKYGDNSAAGVLATGESVCEGYASIFVDICQHLDLKCIKISGYSVKSSFRWIRRIQKYTFVFFLVLKSQ